MKKVVLLSGMIVFGAATGINAITMPKTKKKQLSIEEVQYKKILDQKIEALENRKPVYKMLDALIIEDTVKVINFDDGPVLAYPLKWNIDWAAIFHILDSMKGVISVNEYRTPMIVKANLLYEYEDPAEYLLLDIAVEQNNLSAAKTLLEKYKANPNRGRPYSPFRRAIETRLGNTPLIKLLIQHGGDNTLENDEKF